MDLSESTALLAAAVERAPGLLCVVTGAGISLASGIPTFRGTDPKAIWKQDVTELGTLRFFRQDPVASWRWYLGRFSTVQGARPNAGHQALAALERWQHTRGKPWLLVTQNIDTLHEEAGSRDLVKVHGSWDRVRCANGFCPTGRTGKTYARSDFNLDAFVAQPSLEHLPHCPDCGEVLRMHVLWFDEFYQSHPDYQWSRVMAAVEAMSVVVFVGTSFSVGVTEVFASRALQAGIPAFSIDPSGARLTGVTVLSQRAEELLPAVAALLGAV